MDIYICLVKTDQKKFEIAILTLDIVELKARDIGLEV